MVRFLVRIVVVLLVLAAILYGVGSTMPRDHLVASRVQLTAPRDSVWAVLSAFGDYPKWDSDFKSSVRGKPHRGREVWVQEAGRMTMSLEVKSAQAPSRLVTEIVTDDKSDWGGVWTYDLVANGIGTEVTITEDGWIKPPLFRVLMRVMGTHATMDGVLKSLGARFGDQVAPEHIQ